MKKIIKRVKAQTSPMNRFVGRLNTILSTAFAIALYCDVFPPEDYKIKAVVYCAMFATGGDAFYRMLKTKP